MAEFERVHVRKDESMHNYLVPDYDIEAFDKAQRKCEETPMRSDEWYDAVDEFSNIANSYRIDGLGTEELYIKKD